MSGVVLFGEGQSITRRISSPTKSRILVWDSGDVGFGRFMLFFGENAKWYWIVGWPLHVSYDLCPVFPTEGVLLLLF